MRWTSGPVRNENKRFTAADFNLKIHTRPPRPPFIPDFHRGRPSSLTFVRAGSHPSSPIFIGAGSPLNSVSYVILLTP